MTKNYVCHILYLRKDTSCDCGFWYTYAKWWHLQMFFSVFEKLIFPILWSVKQPNMAQNDNKLCLSDSLSQELYLIWLWFLIHLCKMMISPASFFIFSKFWFFGFLGGRVKGQKMTHNYQFQSVTLYISRNVDHIMKIVGTQV